MLETRRRSAGVRIRGAVGRSAFGEIVPDGPGGRERRMSGHPAAGNDLARRALIAPILPFASTKGVLRSDRADGPGLRLDVSARVPAT